MKRKPFFSIRETSQKTSLPPHTIRYYEKQFPAYLNIKRTDGGHRVYTDETVERLKLIIKLIKKEGLTLKGAKKQIALLNTSQENSDESEEKTLIQTLLKICQEKSLQIEQLKSYQKKKLAQLQQVTQ